MVQDGSLHRTYRKYIGNDTNTAAVIETDLEVWYKEWKDKVCFST